jgi:hypothetical protein
MNLDLGVHSGDVGVDRVDPAQHPDQQETVVVIEVSGEGLLESWLTPTAEARPSVDSLRCPTCNYVRTIEQCIDASLLVMLGFKCAYYRQP